MHKTVCPNRGALKSNNKIIFMCPLNQIICSSFDKKYMSVATKVLEFPGIYEFSFSLFVLTHVSFYMDVVSYNFLPIHPFRTVSPDCYWNRINFISSSHMNYIFSGIICIGFQKKKRMYVGPKFWETFSNRYEFSISFLDI